MKIMNKIKWYFFIIKNLIKGKSLSEINSLIEKDTLSRLKACVGILKGIKNNEL